MAHCSLLCQSKQSSKLPLEQCRGQRAGPQRQHGLPDGTADQPGPYGLLRLRRLPQCGRVPPAPGTHAAPPGPAQPPNAALPGDKTQKGKTAPALEDLAVGPRSVRKNTAHKANLAAWQCGGRRPGVAAGAQPCRHQDPPGPASPSCGLLATPAPASSPVSCPAGTKHRLAC